MLFVGTSIIHPSTEGVFLLCNILDLLIYSLLVFSITILNNIIIFFFFIFFSCTVIMEIGIITRSERSSTYESIDRN